MITQDLIVLFIFLLFSVKLIYPKGEHFEVDNIYSHRQQRIDGLLIGVTHLP